MADYQLTADPNLVYYTPEQLWIPNDPANRHWVEYEEWLAVPNTPDPYVEPPPAQQTPTQAQTVAFDHENRIRTLEGQPPLTLVDFVDKMTAPP